MIEYVYSGPDVKDLGQSFIPNCDRCRYPTLGTQWVECYLGCQHFQCDLCAECTMRERANELSQLQISIARNQNG